jgi:hypothetical protein
VTSMVPEFLGCVSPLGLRQPGTSGASRPNFGPKPVAGLEGRRKSLDQGLERGTGSTPIT